MENRFNSVYHRGIRKSLLGLFAVIYCCSGLVRATPLEWMYAYEEDQTSIIAQGVSNNFVSPPPLSCLPQVNVSLGTGGYALITSIMLVNAPNYPPFMYDVDIMGPLDDVVYCEQIGQSLMVLVTELPTGNACMSTIFVEDKLKPVLTCTPDILPCNTDINSINFFDFLDGVSDNCDPNPHLVYQYVVQNLPCNPDGYTQQIAVLWTATDDSGNSTSCQDIIYLQKPSINSIVFPPDVTVSCPNPNLDPSVTGQPTFNGQPIGAACQFMVTFSDQVVPMCNGAQKTIRLWTVRDLCTNAVRTDAQEIIMIDDVPPMLTCPANITIGTDPGVCTTKYTLQMPLVSDLCANTAMIDIKIFVSGIPGIFAPGQMVNLGLGTTSITIRATDPCGNSAMCQYNVTVRDNTPPVIVCNSLTVGLGPDGMAFLIANNLNFPIIENCGIQSRQIWRMSNSCGVPEDLVPGPDIKFCCEDAGDTIMVSFKVTDLSGNMNTCMFEVIVKDQIPPVARCEDLTISIAGGGTIIITPSQIDAGSTDNCFITDTLISQTTFDCDDIGENIVTLTVIDQSGNSSTCTATVTIVDEVPPVAVCQDITVTVDDNGLVEIIAEQIDGGSTDNCVIDTIFLNEYEFDCTEEGINIVVLTVVDEAGNASTCTATVTVMTSPPNAVCQDITVSLDELGMITITAAQVDGGSTDDCGIDELIVTPGEFNCDDIGENIVTLTVIDISGNESTCTAIVTVEDNMPPVAICVDISVMLDGMGMAAITASLIDGGSNDNCGDVSIEIDNTLFDCEDVGPNVVTLTVTDNAGNESTCTAIVTVLMPDPPMAICQDITVTLEDDGTIVVDPGSLDGGSTTQCGMLTFELDQDTFNCEDLGPNVVTLTVTDETGASSTCTATITVNEGPPTAICQDITVGITGNMVVITGEQIGSGSTDDCGIVTYEVTPNTFDCEDVGESIEVILTVTDESGNSSTCTAIVTITDEEAPIAICEDITVSLNGDGIVVIDGIDIGFNSTDNCEIFEYSVEPDTLTCENLGDNVVILTVTDESGNTSTCTAIVTVIAELPSATCQDITVSLGPDGTVLILPSEVDGGSQSNCGGITLTLDEDLFDCTELGENIVVLTVTDESGATSTCTATVTITDETAPDCSAADITVSLDENGIVTIEAEDINDGSADNCTITTLTITPDDFTCDDIGPNTVTLTVTDQSGNSSTCTAVVTVTDEIAPVCNAQDITVSLAGNMVTIIGEQVNDGSTDNCGPLTFEVTPNTFDCDDLGPNLVILTVTDGSGNSSTCTATVTVIETMGGLVANCQNVTIFLDSNGNAFIDPEQVNNGSGGGCTAGMLTFDLSQTDFDCTDLGANIVTLTVTDDEGNTATCTAIVTVIDNMPPSITCPANVTVACDAVTNPMNTAQFGNATASDNCGFTNISENAVFNLNDCNVGTITRTFTASDASGNTVQCVQVVTINNPNPFTESDITWPASPINVNICNSTAPQNIPNGTPVFDPASLQCANPVATFSDMVVVIVDNNPATPCQVITRTWTVTDNCQPNGTFMFVQTINVIDMANPVFTNINDMTKVAGPNCTAFFTLIASATDCAGVTITNNSPYGATTGANASGDYPIGQTVVIFTATDGCGNTSTMDVVITVTDPDPTEFLCEKVIIILPPETEIAVTAETFITFIPGGCTDEHDFIISYSRTNAFDTLRLYDCGDVGVSTFSLYFWNLSGSMLVDSCDNADLDLRDPQDHCLDGLVLFGSVASEEGQAVSGVAVNVTNAPMLPAMTNEQGEYVFEGLNEGVGYEIAPFNDKNHRQGVSTLDLVYIQKHLLGLVKLNSPYKIIASDANRSGHITALDILEIRKLILGIQDRYAHNTSWRFVDRAYDFPDPYNPFGLPFAESIWIDSVTATTENADFVGIKIGDVNGSYFKTKSNGIAIEPRSVDEYRLLTRSETMGGNKYVNSILVDQQKLPVAGFQLSVFVGQITRPQMDAIHSDILSEEHWWYDPSAGVIHLSWSSPHAQILDGKTILEWESHTSQQVSVFGSHLEAEAYHETDHGVELMKIRLLQPAGQPSVNYEYQLYQNIPNPFCDGTVISFTLPKTEEIILVVSDVTGREVFRHQGKYDKGRQEVKIDGLMLKNTSGIYYYTLYTETASLTRKMSYHND